MTSIPVNWGNLSQPAAVGPMPPAYESTLRSVETAFNVASFGARGDGVTDDTAAIQAAINACVAAGGGIVSFPPGIYVTSAALVIPGNNVRLQGAGAVAGNTNAARWGATIIQPSAGAQYDAISTPLPPTPGTAGYVIYGAVIADLTVDCRNVTGTTTGQGNGIHFYGVRYGRLYNVNVFSSPNWAFLIEGDGTNFAYNTDLYSCLAGGCAAGFRFSYGEQCNLYRCISEGANTACAALQPYNGTQVSTAAYQLYGNAGWTFASNCTFGTSGNYTGPAVLLDNGETGIIDSCLFDSVHGIAIQTNAGGHILSNNAINNTATTTAAAAISLGGGGSVVRGNVFKTNGGFLTSCVIERGVYTPPNLISDNQVIAGTAAPIVIAAGSSAQVKNNVGYNPLGYLAAQPAVPASATAYTNTNGVDCTVYIAGGTVTVIAVGGTATGAIAGAFRVAAGQTITLTYSVAPTWTWFGD